MQAIFFVVLVALTCQCFGLPMPISDGKCNEEKFASCALNFLHLFGFSAVPNGKEFVAALNTFLIKHDVSGFEAVCKSVNEFKSCTSPQTKSCISLDNLGKLHLTQKDAITYVSVYENLAYTCGEGYKVFKENFQCIMKTNHTEFHTLVQCGKDFYADMQKDPTKACVFAQKLIICLSVLFGNNCGKTVGNTFCEQQKHQIKVPFPQCDKLKCV